MVKYRIDGVLYRARSPSIAASPAIISRLKVMSELDIAERRIPQDGRFKVRFKGRSSTSASPSCPPSMGRMR